MAACQTWGRNEGAAILFDRQGGCAWADHAAATAAAADKSFSTQSRGRPWDCSKVKVYPHYQRLRLHLSHQSPDHVWTDWARSCLRFAESLNLSFSTFKVDRRVAWLEALVYDVVLQPCCGSWPSRSGTDSARIWCTASNSIKQYTPRKSKNANDLGLLAQEILISSLLCFTCCYYCFANFKILWLTFKFFLTFLGHSSSFLPQIVDTGGTKYFAEIW